MQVLLRFPLILWRTWRIILALGWSQPTISLNCHINPSSRPVTDDIGDLANIQLFYVGFSQKNGAGVVHIDGKRLIYHAHPRGVKRKNRQDLSENVMIHGSTRYDFVKPQRIVALISWFFAWPGYCPGLIMTVTEAWRCGYVSETEDRQVNK